MPNWNAIESDTTGPTSRNTRPISRNAANRSPGAARSRTCGATNQSSAPKTTGATANQMYGVRHVPGGDGERRDREAALGVAEREGIADQGQQRIEERVRDVVGEVRRGDRSEEDLAAPLLQRKLLDRGFGRRSEGRLVGDRGHAISSSRMPSRTLSMSRVFPTRAASDTTARSAGRTSSSRVKGSAADTYSSETPVPSVYRTTAFRRRSGSRAPPSHNSRALKSPRESASAARRSTVERYRLRELIARPSGSRTIGQPTTRTPRRRSRLMVWTTRSCWKSFWPK